MIKQLKRLVFGIASALLVPTWAHGVILDFEDLAGRPFFVSMPANYAGIDWAPNFWAYDQPQSPFTPHSGIVRIANNGFGAGDSSFRFLAGDVQFDGAWFAGAVPVNFLLFDNNVLVHTSSILLATDTPQFLSSGYAGSVDEVRIVGDDGQYVFDDLQFGLLQQVPEPATLLLVSIGLAGLGFRRRKHAAT